MYMKQVFPVARMLHFRASMFSFMSQPTRRRTATYRLSLDVNISLTRKTSHLICLIRIFIEKTGGETCSSDCSLRTSSISIPKKLVRNAESQIPSQTYWMRICILTRALDEFRHMDIWETLAERSTHPNLHMVKESSPVWPWRVICHPTSPWKFPVARNLLSRWVVRRSDHQKTDPPLGQSLPLYTFYSWSLVRNDTKQTEPFLYKATSWISEGN